MGRRPGGCPRWSHCQAHPKWGGDDGSHGEDDGDDESAVTKANDGLGPSDMEKEKKEACPCDSDDNGDDDSGVEIGEDDNGWW